VNCTSDNKQVFEKARIIFLCVKPTVMQQVAGDANTLVSSYESEIIIKQMKEKTLVSILAGTSTTALSQAFSGIYQYGLNIARIMPNTPLMVGQGASAICSNIRRPPNEEGKVNFNVIIAIFSKLGIIEIVDESKFHAITGLSGSGPAYVYIMIEALSDAGVKQGLPRDLATKFAAQTLLGAAKTVLETQLPTSLLKDQVTSPGGTTIHAVHELEKGRIRDTLINAVEAATQRSKEMANQK